MPYEIHDRFENWREVAIILTFLAGVAAFVLHIIHPEWLAFAHFADQPLVPVYLSIILVGGGFLLWFISITTLGSSWSGIPQLRARHRLVTTGPYRHMRNPIYTSFLLMGLGMALSATNWLVGPPLLLVGLLCCLRIPVEERFLRQRYPAEYDAYRARSGRLFPKLRRR
jgi:protein-S-isoprenylcysteine O-methyltransferase Ste14